VAHELVTAVPDAGLGNSAYLVDLGDGRALAVDASRDLRALRRAAALRGVRVAYAADTHLHADFLSGAVQLHVDNGAEILASRAGRREFPHRGLEDGDEVDLGGLTLRTLATPGHTDEHLSLLLLDGTRELGVFSGGSLITGSAARVDLVSPDRTIELARAQYRSVHRLAQLAPTTLLWPTHGGGSFCSASAVSGSASTIAAERETNPLLATPDVDTFVRLLTETAGSFPTYFQRLGEENRRGPDPLSGAWGSLPLLTGDEAAQLAADGAVLVDVRPIAAVSASHPAGALSIPLRPAFASWLGWLAPHDRPLVVLREPGQDLDDLVWQAAKIGYTNLAGEIAGGIAAWQAAGLPTAVLPLTDPAELGDVRLIDVRQASEYAAGHAPSAINVELGSIRGRLVEPDDRPTVLMCGHGERAMTAASILAAAGVENLTVLVGGPDDVTA